MAVHSVCKVHNVWKDCLYRCKCCKVCSTLHPCCTQWTIWLDFQVEQMRSFSFPLSLGSPSPLPSPPLPFLSPLPSLPSLPLTSTSSPPSLPFLPSPSPSPPPPPLPPVPLAQDHPTLWYDSFTCCADCNKLRDKGNFCPVCNEAYADNDFESKMVQCASCFHWVHAHCEDMTGQLPVWVV